MINNQSERSDFKRSSYPYLTNNNLTPHRIILMHYLNNLFKNKLTKQFISLASIQAINLLVPLIIIPYVSRILGPEKLGMVNFATSFLTYFTLLINYGFDYSATREISISRGNEKKLNDIVNITLACKFVLFIISSLIYVLLIISSKRYYDEIGLYISSYLILISAVFYSTWLFQGYQSLSIYTSLSLIFRIISVIFTIILVKKKSDYVMFQTVYGSSLFFTALITLSLAKFKFKIKFRVVRLEEIFNKLRESFILFLSVVVVNLNTTSSIILLGYLTDYATVGYYSSAVKVYSVIGSLSLFPIGQVIFPHLAQKFNNSVEDGILFIKNIVPKIIIAFSIVVIITIFLSKYIINTLYGSQFKESILILQILSPLLLISTMVNIICYQVMLNLKMDKFFFKINASATLINIIVSLLLVPKLNAFGSCISLYIIELTIIFLSLRILKKNNINLFNLKFL